MEWIQAASGTWHLIWHQHGEDTDERVVYSWCHMSFKWDDPCAFRGSFGLEEILHDECVRQEEKSDPPL